MMRFLTNSKISRPVSFTILLLILTEIIQPTAMMALTGGPSQPEVQSFEPISTTDMVDIFSGDFKYNIPLLDIEGYPINIAYNSGISTDQEASWVGLGWNLNPGAINRTMRGLPDDFKGETVKKEFNMKPNSTYGLSAGFGFELFGKEATKPPGSKKGKIQKLLHPGVSVGASLNYNNYTGFGVGLSTGLGISAGVSGKGKLDAGLGLHSSANEGLDVSPSISYSNNLDEKDEKDNVLTKTTYAGGAGLSGTYNSRAGLKQIGFSAKLQKTVEKSFTGTTGAALEMMGIPTGISKTVGKGRSAAGTINFGSQSYVPNINMPMVNTSAALGVKFGAELFGVDGNLELGGHYSTQRLKEKSKEVSAWGFIYSEYGQNDRNSMMDFNREKDGSFARTTKNLPLSNFTYDVYSVTGQGSVSGAFRPFRGDIGHVFDNASQSESDSYSLGAEVASGNLVKIGTDVSIVDVNNTSGKWESDNGALDYFKFKGKINNNSYEPYYFKAVGEKSENGPNNSLFTSLGGQNPYAIRFKQGGGLIANNAPIITSVKELEEYPNATSSLLLNPALNSLSAREKRNQSFSVLTRAEAKKFGLQKNLYNTTGVDNIDNAGNQMMIYNASSTAFDHHIGEVNVVSQDGSRYFYGLPVYNTVNKEVSFNCSGNSLRPNGLVEYSGSDATVNNSKGTDNYFNSVEIPQYAYSYLLTAIVSSDYVDQDGDGPDDDDIGNYTKFHYNKAPGGEFKWRMPIDFSSSNPVANYNQNSKSNDKDDMASFTYGEKEIYYLDEIQTKNYIAKFVTSNRSDSKGSNVDGNAVDNTVLSKQLDKIILYSKPEYLANGSNAVPIKTIHFVYDYSLCQGTPNSGASGNGKLTLKKVFFTYGKSNRAVFNKYEFTYAHNSGVYNPSYNNKAYDRWGNYKPEQGTVQYGYNDPRTNAEFPYSVQDTTNANIYNQAWNLTKIDLPTGGEIHVNYESDDYAYVQNAPAGQMFDILGCTSSVPVYGGTFTNKLYNSTSSPDDYLYLVVDGIDPAIASSDQQFKNYYLKDINDGNKKMFFRFLVNLRNQNMTVGSPAANFLSNLPNTFYEYVSGYADIDLSNCGLIYNSGVATGQAYIKLKAVNLKNKGTGPQVNPIAKAAIQFGRINFGAAVFDYDFNPPADVEDAIKQMAQQIAGALKNLIAGFKNPNKTLIDKNYCMYFKPEKSMVRLYNGNSKKLGGGSRVRRLHLVDNWDAMTTVGSNSQTETVYTQEYTYEETDEYGRQISSGVASYEPAIGGEENSLKQPYYLGQNKWTPLAPDDRFYVEGPFGESFFPSPSVGYSKVKVRNIFPPNATSNYKNGYKVYEFYTAKDYPTITEHTPIIPKQHRNPLKSLLKIFSRDYISASQGYVVKTNDMHGKVKAEIDYSEGKNKPEKETRFYYKTKGGEYSQPSQIGLTTDAFYSKNELENTCSVIDKDGGVTQKPIGIDFDAVADFRESETTTLMAGAQINVSFFLVGIVPTIVPSIWPSLQFERSRFRSAVLTKVINQYGILDRTDVTVDDSKVSTQSLAFDAETGDALVTKTTNDFQDPFYNVKYPSHWGYDLMGQASKNIGMAFNNVSYTSGNYVLSGASTYLKPGDELGLTTTSGYQRAWVCNSSSSGFNLIDENGISITQNNVNLKVIRSAWRNQLSSQMASLTCLKNPILPLTSTTGTFAISSATTQIVNSNGVVYSDKWQMPRGFITSSPGNNCTCSVSQTGLDLINVLESLFNTPSNQGTNGFFNGSFTGPLTSYPTPAPTMNPFLWTLLWTDPSYGACPNPSNPLCIIPTGFNSSTSYPTYNNYGLTSNLLNQLPNSNAINCGSLPNPQYVTWNGPGVGSGITFNSSYEITGFFFECDDQCYVKLDFSDPSNNMSTNAANLINYFDNLPPTSGNYVDIIPNSSQTDCSASSIACTFNIYNSSNTLLFSGPIKIKSSCLSGNLLNCNNGNQGSSGICGKLENYKANPYFEGIRGNWRVKSNHTFLTDRVQTIDPTNNNSMDIRKDGYYLTFAQLYNPPATAGVNPWVPWSFTTNTKWVNTVEITRYNQFGNEIETKDALGRYSSALYGYNDSYPIAVASNAQLQEIGYDGFEDYGFYYACKKEHHFDFYNYSASRSTLEAHTGIYSLKVPTGNTYTQTKAVNNPNGCFNPNVSTPGSPSYACSYTLKCYDFNYPFSPNSVLSSSGSKYVVSYWVKQSYTGTAPLDYINNNVSVTQGSGPAFTTSNYKKSVIIDGWQKVEYTFLIPSGYIGPLSVNLINASAGDVYFDDIRIHPFTSNMKTFVYHPVTLKYVAELDANNFATFYEYDEQGNLIRVKKETERGVMTIKESKTHFKL